MLSYYFIFLFTVVIMFNFEIKSQYKRRRSPFSRISQRNNFEELTLNCEQEENFSSCQKVSFFLSEILFRHILKQIASKAKKTEKIIWIYNLISISENDNRRSRSATRSTSRSSSDSSSSRSSHRSSSGSSDEGKRPRSKKAIWSDDSESDRSPRRDAKNKTTHKGRKEAEKKHKDSDRKIYRFILLIYFIF